MKILNRKMAIALIASSALVGVASAAIPGAYVGAGIGTSVLETPRSQLFQQSGSTSASREMGGFGARLFGGYNFNNYFGLEAGYVPSYASSKYKGSTGSQNSSIKYEMKSLDVVGKAYLPISQSGFNVYALGGLAYVNSTTKFENGGVPVANGVSLSNGSHTTYKTLPRLGAGVSYDVSPQMTTSLEFSHLQGRGNVKTSNSAIPSADMLLLNLSYNFS